MARFEKIRPVNHLKNLMLEKAQMLCKLEEVSMIQMQNTG